MNIENDIVFLSHFLDEGVYFADNELIIKKTVSDAVEKPIQQIPEAQPEIPKVEIPKTIVSEIKKVSTPLIVIEPKPVENLKTYKKVIILVSYKNGLPDAVSENLYLTFNALAVQKTEIEIINVTVANPSLLDAYNFDFLVLMGGNGKSLNVLKNYAGNSVFYEVGSLEKSKIIFVEKMDVYMLPENKALKIKYWETLKKAFGKA